MDLHQQRGSSAPSSPSGGGRAGSSPTMLDGAAGFVTVCPYPNEPSHTVDLPTAMDDAPTTTILVDHVPSFLTIPEALVMLLSTAETAAGTAQQGATPDRQEAVTPSGTASADDTTALRLVQRSAVQSVHVVLSTSPSSYAVLMTFDSTEATRAIRSAHHLKRMTTLSEERLVVSYLQMSLVGAGAAEAVLPAHPQHLSPHGATVVPGPPPLGMSREPSSDQVGTNSTAAPGGGLRAMNNSSSTSSTAATDNRNPFPPPPVSGSPTKQQQPQIPRVNSSPAGAATALDDDDLGGGSGQRSRRARSDSPVIDGALLHTPISTPVTAGRASSPPHLPPAGHQHQQQPQSAAATTAAVCSICIEPLGRSGRLPTTTLPCLHSFDLACFVQVEDGVCPNCRYNITESRASCTECGATADLWMCLVTGQVFCGRYGNGHVAAHYRQDAAHRYFMQVGGLRVWDAVSDAFVHRIITTLDGGVRPSGGEEGGTSSPSSAGARPSAFNWADFADSDDDDLDGDVEASGVVQSRLDAVATYYAKLQSDLLVSQQRHFYAAQQGAIVRPQEALIRAECDGRTAIATESAAELSQLVDESLAELAALSRSSKRRSKALKARHEDAEATVSALERNVAKLRTLVAQSAAGSGESTTAADAAAARKARAEDEEIEKLEARLSQIYSQFT